jgi:hypothetical protein
MRHPGLCLLLSALATGCAAIADPAACEVGDVRAAIDAELQKGAQATIDEDIEAYMDGVPADYRIAETDGSVTDRATLRANALRSWAVIDRTIGLGVRIDQIDLEAGCQAARVMTSQRWERVMRRPDDSGSDTVLTTQTHEERWRLTDGRWYNFEIKELGGEIFVNGEPYVP